MLFIKSTFHRWFNSGRSRASLLLSVAFVVSATSATPMARSAEIEAVRLWRAPDHTRVVLDLSGDRFYEGTRNFFTHIPGLKYFSDKNSHW